LALIKSDAAQLIHVLYVGNDKKQGVNPARQGL
jgi:hypothetical protein